MMPTWLNRANLYLLGWCIYISQGVLFPKGNIFTQLLVLALLMVSLYYVFVANVRYKLPDFFYGLNILLFMFFVYGTYFWINFSNSSDFSQAIDGFSYLKNILLSLLPLYAFYVLFTENRISEKQLYVWIFIFIIITTINFFETQRAQLLAAMLTHSNKEEFTNNVGYVFLALIPGCALLYKKPILQYVTIGYCMVFIIMAMKRGAIIIAIICLGWFLWNNLRNSSSKMRLGLIVMSVALCFVGYLLVQQQMENSAFFQLRIEKTFAGDSSGRNELYQVFANYFWNEASPLQFLFGSGANATLKISYNYAHNDWLEIAVNQGILGLVVYAMFFIFFARSVRKRYCESHIKLAMQLLFMIYFMKTMFSMSYAAMHISYTFVLGSCLTRIRRE